MSILVAPARKTDGSELLPAPTTPAEIAADLAMVEAEAAAYFEYPADEAIHYADAETGECNNCGMLLSKENIDLALEDAGLDITADDLTFCCPSYTDATGCRGYAVADRQEMAYWRTA